MSNSSPLDLLDSRLLPALVVELLRHAADAARASNVEWFVGGATARFGPYRLAPRLA
ncbi:hypothetical protein [Paraburkholderia sp. SIMBA_030]|uniref:hypothetical protein n=1 Tax=Paraburkholderia sp. SIMBA_030 TaxID=3085773 RepID=UPI00397C0892